jgi:RimJ/RimL family protein N-acetyltransferase
MSEAQRTKRVRSADRFPVPEWRRPAPPPALVLAGRWCRLEPLDPERHADELFAAYARDPDARHWTYLPYGPFADAAEYRAGWIAPVAATIRSSSRSWMPRLDAPRRRELLRIDPRPARSRSATCGSRRCCSGRRAATEAMFLMMRNAFDLGYRRYEWKCDALNAPSRAGRASPRPLVRGHLSPGVVMKGRNRDTAWFAATIASGRRYAPRSSAGSIPGTSTTTDASASG